MHDLEPRKDLFLLSGADRTLISQVEKFFQHLPFAHSAYQVRNFIIGQFERSSPDRGHRQALLEIHTRYHSLLQHHYQYRKTELEIKEHGVNLREAQYKLDNVAGEQFERERLRLAVQKAELEIRMREFGLSNIRRAISETLREIRCFKEEMERLEPLCQYPLSERYERCEPEYWRNEYLHKYIQGKRGENLPEIPQADKDRLIESLAEKVRQLEDKE